MPKDKGQFSVLLEEIGSNVKLALEGHQIIRNELKQMEDRLAEKIKENQSAIKFVAGKVNGIDKKLDEHIRQPAHA